MPKSSYVYLNCQFLRRLFPSRWQPSSYTPPMAPPIECILGREFIICWVSESATFFQNLSLPMIIVWELYGRIFRQTKLTESKG